MKTQEFSVLRWHNSEMGTLHHFPDSNVGPKKIIGERKVFLTFRTGTTGYPHEIKELSITTSHHTHKNNRCMRGIYFLDKTQKTLFVIRGK